MRLIDADALKQFIGNDTILKNNICRMIDVQPTAYDVEAKVAELEKEKEIHTEHFHISLYKDYPEIKQMYEKVCLVIDKAISIVRGKE